MTISMRTTKQVFLLFFYLSCHINPVFSRPNTKPGMFRKARSYSNVIEGSYDNDAVNEMGKSTKYPNGILEKLDTSRTNNLHTETGLEQEFVRRGDADMSIESSNSLQENLKKSSQQLQSKRQSRSRHPCVESSQSVPINGVRYSVVTCKKRYYPKYDNPYYDGGCRPVKCRLGSGRQIPYTCECASSTKPAVIPACSSI